jgi:DNA (cytosine-5)-methyltransferase 1
MRYLSVCSGIEAATAAWHPLGWEAAAFSEIEKFPRAVLQHHYPDVPLHGDFTTIGADEYGPIDLLVGGTPCQSFSIAGLRGGLADDRGNLALEFLKLADRTRARWLVWENVPGVLSSNGGRDFGSILGGLAELGYGFAYRVLDAQFFGVPQRRRRVFVVGHLGDWRRAAAVLFERHSLSGHPAPRREAREAVAALTANGVGACGADDNQGQAEHLIHCHEDAPTLNAAFGSKLGLEDQHINGGAGHFVAHSLRGEGFDANEDGTGRGTPLVPVQSFNWQSGGDARGLALRDNVSALTKEQTPAICLGGEAWRPPENEGQSARLTSAVRRLTPREAERLQGFPDDYTLIPWRGKPADECPDGPRYKALGNSMAVPVMRWIGERIAAVDAVAAAERAARSPTHERPEHDRE